MSYGSDNLEYLKTNLRISSLQMESHRHAWGEELGVLWHCHRLDLPSPQWHTLALGTIMSQQGWIQNSGEKSSEPHRLSMQRLQERCCTSTECAQGSLCVMCWRFLVALLRPEAAQLCPFASTSQGRCTSRKLLLTSLTYGSTETFLKLRLKHCLSLACPCLNAYWGNMYPPSACHITEMENQS